MRYKLPLLIGGDVLISAFAWFAAFALRFGPLSVGAELNSKPQAAPLMFMAVTVVCSYIFDCYEISRPRRKRGVLGTSMAALIASFALLSAVYFLLPQDRIGRGLLALALGVFGSCQILWRLLFTGVCRHPLLAEKVLVLGTGPIAARIGELIHSSQMYFEQLQVRYLPYGDAGAPVAVPGLAVVSGPGDLLSLALRERVSQIVVSGREACRDPQLHHTLLNCRLHGIQVLDAPTFLEPITGKLMLEGMDADWLIYADGFRRTRAITILKRAIDVLLALTGLVLAAPLLPLACLLVKLDSPGPVFYSQVRVGQYDKPFVLYKLRTMRQEAERESGAAWAKPNDPRVGRIGRLLRKCRLDEIPQLYNVLKGDMSFIGPRPERPEFVQSLEREIPFYGKRHFIKPGLTGWAQINFPYGASVEDSYEKLRYDLYYFKNMSVILDTVIFLKTFRVVMLGDGGR